MLAPTIEQATQFHAFLCLVIFILHPICFITVVKSWILVALGLKSLGVAQGCSNILTHTCISSDGQSGSGMWDSNYQIRAILTGKVSSRSPLPITLRPSPHSATLSQPQQHIQLQPYCCQCAPQSWTVSVRSGVSDGC